MKINKICFKLGKRSNTCYYNRIERQKLKNLPSSPFIILLTQTIHCLCLCHPDWKFLATRGYVHLNDSKWRKKIQSVNSSVTQATFQVLNSHVSLVATYWAAQIYRTFPCCRKLCWTEQEWLLMFLSRDIFFMSAHMCVCVCIHMYI